MALTEDEEFELLSLEREKAMSSKSKTQKIPDSISTQGVGFVKEHPFLTLLQGAPQTITGKSMEQRAVDNVNSPDFMQSKSAPFDKYIPQAGQAAFNRIVGGQMIDQATAPINYVGGAAIDAGGKALGKLVPPALRAYKRIVNRINPENIPNINVNPVERLNELLKISTRAAQQDKEGIRSSISSIRQLQKQEMRDINNQVKDARTYFNNSINESRNVLKTNLRQLNNELQNAAETGAIDFQKKLPEFFRANSEAYGDRLDVIADSLSASGQGITRGQISTMIDNTLKDLDEALVPDGAAKQSIISLRKKYLSETKEIPSKILSSTGKPIKTGVTSNVNDMINFKEIIQDIKNVRSHLSSGAASGRTGFSQEDLAVQFLNNNLGNFIKDRVPAFAKLQSDYAPVIRAMKEGHKIFKPNQGEFNTLTATNFLKKAGMGKLESGQEKVLDALESGNKFSTGVGNITSGVKGVGNKIKKVVEDSPIDKIRGNLQNKLIELDKRKRDLLVSNEKNINVKLDELQKIEKVLKKRVEDLGIRKQEIIRIQSNKKNAKAIRNALLGAVAIGAGAATTVKYGKNLFGTFEH